MPKRDDAPTGAPCWVDLMTSQPDASRRFYCDLFGWTIEDPGPDYGGYVNFSADGVLVAGSMRNEPEMQTPDVWSVYLATGDAAATTEAAAANGGNVIVPAMDVMALGRMAVVSDAGDAAIGIWQPGEHRGFGVWDEPNTPGWFELHTRSYDASVDFYRKVFGWETRTEGDEPGFRYTTQVVDGEQLAGIMDASDFLPEGVPAHWSVYFRVADADATLARIVELGGSVVMPAEDTPYGRLATASDVTGAVFKLRG
jgi:predicted enzyme related to lactoylglutathione lyase